MDKADFKIKISKMGDEVYALLSDFYRLSDINTDDFCWLKSSFDAAFYYFYRELERVENHEN